MPRFASTLMATVVVAAALAGNAAAQQMRLFDSQEALDAEIAGHMADGSFSALVEAVAPPSRMSVGRIRILEQAFTGDIPSLHQAVPIFHSKAADPVVRDLTAWWEGEIYVYLGLLTHTREDGVAVLDFILTGDIRKASRWYLTAEIQ